jgi:hypothetical protein
MMGPIRRFHGLEFNLKDGIEKGDGPVQVAHGDLEPVDAEGGLTHWRLSYGGPGGTTIFAEIRQAV